MRSGYCSVGREHATEPGFGHFFPPMCVEMSGREEVHGSYMIKSLLGWDNLQVFFLPARVFRLPMHSFLFLPPPPSGALCAEHLFPPNLD